jgi:hypothetical protein
LNATVVVGLAEPQAVTAALINARDSSHKIVRRWALSVAPVV